MSYMLVERRSRNEEFLDVTMFSPHHIEICNAKGNRIYLPLLEDLIQDACGHLEGSNYMIDANDTAVLNVYAEACNQVTFW
jgi:hypothetical protein